MAKVLSHLLAPGRIGSLELRNRIVMPGMGVFLGDESANGCLNEEQLAHWTERARGGAGLVIVEVTPVMFPVGATTLRQPGLSTDEHEASFAELARRVHAHGGALGTQLVHHGKVALADATAGRPVLVPSADAHPVLAYDMLNDLSTDEQGRLFRAMGGSIPEPHEATEDDLLAVIDAFGRAAVRARRAGLDCVEVHGAHGYLISSFLSRAYNRRVDGWGGSAENRARLLCEVVRSIKQQAGVDFPVIVRLDGTEFRTPGGITVDEACVTAGLAVVAGADAIHVSAYADPTSGVGFTDAPLPWKEGQYVELVAAVGRHVDVPVIAVGRLLPEPADRLVAEGTADFVAMGRQLLADPELPNKLRDGRTEDVRPCINCFVCVASAFFDEPSACAVNGRMGRQAITLIEPTAEPKRVVVIGAGPAGLECARIAARRGHHVVVLERSGQVGGTALVSALVMPLNAALVRFLERDARDAGVVIRTDAPATPELVGALQPDVVVVATGAKRVRPDVPGAELPHVWSGDDLRSLLWGDDPEVVGRLSFASRLAVKAAAKLHLTDDPDRVRRLSHRWLPLGERIVVVGGGLVGLELAEFLAERDRTVTVLEAGPVLGTEMAHPRRARAIHEIRALGIALHTDARLVSIRDDAVAWASSDGNEHDVPVDDVILASGTVAAAAAADAFADLGCDLAVIGDAGEVGYLHGAIRSGFDLGRRL